MCKKIKAAVLQTQNSGLYKNISNARRTALCFIRPVNAPHGLCSLGKKRIAKTQNTSYKIRDSVESCWSPE